MVEKEYQYDYLQVQLGGLFGQIYCSNDLSSVKVTFVGLLLCILLWGTGD